VGFGNRRFMHLLKGSGNMNDESDDFHSLVKRGPQGRFENMKFQKKFHENFLT
jgi:hypothetical protein